MTKSPLILLLGELPLPSPRRTLPVIKGFTFPSSRGVGGFGLRSPPRRSGAPRGAQGPAGCRTGAVLGRGGEQVSAGNRARRGGNLGVPPRRPCCSHKAEGSEGRRSGASGTPPGQKASLSEGKKPTCLNRWSESAILCQLNLPPNCEGAKPFEVCHVQSIINHCKSGIISTSIFRSLQIGWCQLALINPASGQLLCLPFMQHFPAEIFKQ